MILRIQVPLVLLLSAAAATGCGQASAGPASAVSQGVTALQEDDLEGFLRATVSPEDFQEIERSWREKRDEPISAEEEAQFQETMGKLTAKNAADEIYAEIEPQLDGMAQQWSMMVGMLPMMAAPALADAPPGADQALQGLVAKLGAVDVADREKLRGTLEIVTSAARELDVETLADLQALDLDEALARGGIALRAVKDVLDLYGISIDDALASVDVTVLSEEGGKAQVQVSYDLFGSQQETTVSVVEQGGRWLPAPR